jgi:hypothetical protein
MELKLQWDLMGINEIYLELINEINGTYLEFSWESIGISWISMGI